MAGRFAAAVRRLEELHREDPRREAGEPHSLAYHRRMAQWLDRLEPAASEELRLAVRAQHVCRWRISRDQYPAGRTGYLQWRTACKRLHADTAAEVMNAAGYDQGAVKRVERLLLKRGLTRDPELRDPETQTLEDVACVVFLEGYLADFVASFEAGPGGTGGEGDAEEKLIDILRKTWRKMSPRGREAALGLDLPGPVAELVGRALADDAGE